MKEKDERKDMKEKDRQCKLAASLGSDRGKKKGQAQRLPRHFVLVDFGD